MLMLLCMMKTHIRLLLDYLYSEEVLLDFGNTLDKVLQSPSQDRILYYQQSEFFAPVCDLGTLRPLVRFFFILSCWKMHHNDLKCGEIVDNFCYIPKSFCSIKTGWGGNVGYFWASCSEYGLSWNRMDIIALETDSMTSKPLITCITLNVLWKT